MTATDQTVRESHQRMIAQYLENRGITLNELYEVRLEETHQTLGALLVGIEAVEQHLETLWNDAAGADGPPWNGVDRPELLFHSPCDLHPGLRYLGEDAAGTDIWYQSY